MTSTLFQHRLESGLRGFVSSYVIVPGYLEDVVTKVEGMCIDAVEDVSYSSACAAFTCIFFRF